MYCIKCGVQLADTEKSCPLCGTICFHPELSRPKAQPLYPKDQQPQPQFSPTGVMSALTILFLIPILITLLCDLRVNRSITWSGYVAGAILLAYEIVLLPGETDDVQWASMQEVRRMIRGGQICRIIGRQFHRQEQDLLERQTAQA